MRNNRHLDHGSEQVGVVCLGYSVRCKILSNHCFAMGHVDRSKQYHDQDKEVQWIHVLYKERRGFAVLLQCLQKYWKANYTLKWVRQLTVQCRFVSLETVLSAMN